MSDWRRLLESRGIRLRKDLGQHVLHDPQFLAAVAREAAPTPGVPVFEIGAGAGTLTRALVAAGAVGIAVEIDDRLAEIARDFVGTPSKVQGLKSEGPDGASLSAGRPSTGRMEIRVQDVLARRSTPDPGVARIEPGLEADLVRLSETARRPLTIVSNLPYRLYRDIVLAMLRSAIPIDRMVLLVQREGAERMGALPGTRRYDEFSVLVQAAGRVRRLRDVSPAVFWPPPRVRSTLVAWEAAGLDAWRAEGWGELEPVLERLFSRRRKKVGTLLGAAGRAGLEERIRETRLERLGPEDAIRVARRSLEFCKTA